MSVSPVQEAQREAGSRPRVLLLGSDEAAGELTAALRRLGAAVTELAGVPGVADGLAAAIEQLRPDVVVTLTDSLTAQAAQAVGAVLAKEKATKLAPSARSVTLTADQEALRKLAADELGLPTAPCWFAGSLDELKSVAARAGFPLLVRPVAGAGKPKFVKGIEEIDAAWEQAGGRAMAETVVGVEFHITLLAARTDGPDGPVIEFCSPIGHLGADADALESWQPQNLTSAASDAARSIAARIVKALGGRGLFSVELMIDGDEVYFVDVAASPGATSWVTLRSQRVSAFELQARAILGLPVDTMMCSPGAARLVEGSGPPQPDRLAAALRMPESDVWVLGESGTVALATAQDAEAAREGARAVAAALSGRGER